MNARFYLVGLLIAGCLVGCPHNRYEIEMKPAGQVLERTISISRVGEATFAPAEDQGSATKPATTRSVSSESVPAEELTRFAKLYPECSIDLDKNVHTFRGKFTGRTPDDVGGAGSYRQFATRMGCASIYVERFRGDNNPARSVTERLQAVDELTDLLIGWFQSEMGADKRFGKLRQFMDKDFRQDLRNASIYLWLHGLYPKDKLANPEEMFMRIGLYFLERQYFCLEELPAITRALTMKADDGDPVKSLMPLVRRLAASKMGIGPKEPIPDSLKFLSSAKAVEESLGGYLRTTEAFNEKLREWKKQREAKPEATKPEPLEIIGDLAENAFRMEFKIFSSDDELTVKLALPAKPFLTNGDCDEKSKKVVWSSRLENRTQDILSVTLEREDTYNRLPTLCYAVWAVPDEKFQKKHFGKVVLKGQKMLDYCLWRNGLTAKEAREWDGFVGKCRPGKSLLDELEKFRFSDEPPPEEDKDDEPGPTGRARFVIQSITAQLEGQD